MKRKKGSFLIEAIISLSIVVLILSIKVFEAKGISTKYNKYVNLIGGILMLLMGVLLIFKPEWVMLNF